MATRNLWTGNAERWLQRALMAVIVGALGTSMVAGRANAQAKAQEKVLNLYSARHYQTDEALYTNFTKPTGIKINRIEAGEEPLSSGSRPKATRAPPTSCCPSTPAACGAREQEGLFQPVRSDVLTTHIPAEFRAPTTAGSASQARARDLLQKATVNPGDVQTYGDLANPEKGKVCIRSGRDLYNLSLLGAHDRARGPEKAEAWAKGVVANLAAPKGGDTDQIKAVAGGECG